MEQEQIKMKNNIQVFDADKENSQTKKYFEKLTENCFNRKKESQKIFIVVNKNQKEKYYGIKSNK